MKKVYARCRAHTAETHPEWTKQHSHMDTLRIMMKEVLKDLWIEWNKPSAEIIPLPKPETKPARAAVGIHFFPITTATGLVKPTVVLRSCRTPARYRLMPTTSVPGSTTSTKRHGVLEVSPLNQSEHGGG